MTATRFIRYQTDPFQREAFKPSAEGRASFELAQVQRFILREERTWLDDVSAMRDPARQVTP